MEIVEVIIRMPKSEYEELIRGGYTWWGRHGEYIKKGTVLPKGHGKIVDANQVLENGDNWEVETALMQTEAIIEADTKSEEV